MLAVSRDCLIGQPTLARGLRQGIFAALDHQRISVATRSGGGPRRVGRLPDATISSSAGRTDQLIADDAAARLHRYANGIPRGAQQRRLAGLMAAAADGKGLCRRPLREEGSRRANPDLNYPQFYRKHFGRAPVGDCGHQPARFASACRHAENVLGE